MWDGKFLRNATYYYGYHDRRLTMGLEEKYIDTPDTFLKSFKIALLQYHGTTTASTLCSAFLSPNLQSLIVPPFEYSLPHIASAIAFAGGWLDKGREMRLGISFCST
jgi:hypothetical protein